MRACPTAPSLILDKHKVRVPNPECPCPLIGVLLRVRGEFQDTKGMLWLFASGAGFDVKSTD